MDSSNQYLLNNNLQLYLRYRKQLRDHFYYFIILFTCFPIIYHKKINYYLLFSDLVLNNNKKKENHTPRSSTGSVLTFSNPNYNLPDDGSMSEPKVKIWKRLKYDKAQVTYIF